MQAAGTVPRAERWRVAVSGNDGDVVATLLVANVGTDPHQAVMAVLGALRRLGIKRPEAFEYTAERW